MSAKRVRLRVVDSNAPSFTVERHAGTWTRSECPKARPCPRTFCAAHLWLVPGNERPGRPSLRRVPVDELGRKLSVGGDAGPDDREGTIAPRWLESPMPESCALDIIERAAGEPMSLDAIAEVYSKHRTLIGAIVRKALRKLRALGVTREDFERLLREEVRTTNLGEAQERA